MQDLDALGNQVAYVGAGAPAVAYSPPPGELARGAPAGVVAGSIGFGAGGPVWLDEFRSKRAPTPYELVNAYKAVAYACIQLNQMGVCRVPLRLYARTGRNDRRPGRGLATISRSISRGQEKRLRSLPYLSRTLGLEDAIDEIVDHPLLDAFDEPNPYFDGSLLLSWIVQSMDVVGSCYLFPERPLLASGLADVAYAASKLWGLQSQYVFAVKGQGNNLLDYYRYFGDVYTPEKLVRIRHVSLRDPYLSAYSPLHACFEQRGLGDYYTAVVESMMKSGARPELMIGPADSAQPWGEPERKRYETDMNNRFTGGRSGRVWVTTGNVKATPLSYPPADLAGLEISKWERLLVANCFGVPISLLQSEDANKAVAQEGTHQHQYYAVEPRCRMIAAALTLQLARPVDRRLFFAFDDAVDRDEERAAKVFDLNAKAGKITINEERAEEGMHPVPWGDEPWFPQTLVQPSAAAEMRQQRQAARDAMVAAAQQGPHPTVEPDPAEVPEREPVEVQADAGERALETQLGRVLSLIEVDLANRTDGRGHDHAGPVPAAPGGAAGSGERGHARGDRGEHVWAADGGAAGSGTEGTVRRDREASAGQPAPVGDGGTSDVAAAEPARGADGPGDDAAADALLGRVGEAGDGPPGPGPERVEGDQSASAGSGPQAGAELLPEHAGDDVEGSGPGAEPPAA